MEKKIPHYANNPALIKNMFPVQGENAKCGLIREFNRTVCGNLSKRLFKSATYFDCYTD